MRKSTLVKYSIIGIGLITWIWFCWFKIPIYQAETKKEEIKAIIQLQREHEHNFVDIMDSNGVIHSIPRDEYETKDTEMINVPIPQEQSTVEMETEIATQNNIEVPYYNYSEADLELLARLCESEAGIESYQCKVYVASVVLNRCASSTHPDDLNSVIYERVAGTPQFSVTINQNGTCALEEAEPSEDSYKAAQFVLENGSQLPLDVTVFYSSSCDEPWIKSRAIYNTVDHTTFAYYWRSE